MTQFTAIHGGIPIRTSPYMKIYEYEMVDTPLIEYDESDRSWMEYFGLCQQNFVVFKLDIDGKESFHCHPVTYEKLFVKALVEQHRNSA